MPQFNLPGDETTQLFVFEKFGTLNVKASRPAIKDEEFAWNENWMPLGDGNLRTLYAEGVALYTAPVGRTIVFKYAYNIAAISYLAVFLDNGTAVQVRVSDGATTSISAIGNTFYNGGNLPACVQWQSKYLIIVCTVGTNGYFLWDGTHLFSAGTLSPDVTVTDSGANYTSAPTVTAVGGSGSGATFLATVLNGAVTKIVVTNPGTGYLIDDKVQLAFTGGGSDTSAQATATVGTTGGVAAVNITSGGHGATTSSLVTFTGGGGTGAEGVVSGAVNGVVTQISITNPGTGYTSAPTVAVTGSTGFTAVVDVRYGQVSGITVVAGGSGYNDNPQVIISPPDSSAFPVVQATAVAVTTAGAVTSITVTEAGLGYTKPPTVTLVGGNNAAEATITLMPFGVAGTTIETYQNSVWIANGTNAVFSAPGSTSDFSSSGGGGNYTAIDNFLRRQIICLKQTNGFLYQFGDSSINVISNVQTSVSNGVASTTFNNSNVDPQTGSAWRDSIVPFGRALVFANSSGVYALYGGSAEKVSSPIDTLFANATFNTGVGGGVTPTAAVATIFGIRVYMLLFTTVDPYLRVQRTILGMWDGQKWWVASQIAGMSFVITQEIDSNLSSYMTDGTKIYPMFETPSTALSKVFQTKLRGDPIQIAKKQLSRVYITGETTLGSSNLLSVSVDNESGIGSQTSVPVDGILTFIGSDGAPLTFIGSGGPIVWVTAGLVLSQYATPNNYGRYLGLTVATSAADFTLLSMAALFRDYSPVA